MKLEEKGKIIPPPVLSKFSEIVSQEIQTWEGIISATHWEIWNRNKANGADFYFGELELGHIHLERDDTYSINRRIFKKINKSRFSATISIW